MCIPTVYAQNGKQCGTDHAMRELYRSHPQSIKEANKANAFAQRFASQRTTGQSYIIPVVFHVFGTNFAGATVDDEIVKTALEKTNEDFQGLNDDFNTVSSLFSQIKSTLDIQFKLAQIDPDGNPTSGIMYYPELAGFGNGGGYNTQIQQYAWDNYKYMNVYIMLDLYNDGSTTNSGVAWYPDTYMSDNNLARVVYNGRYLYGNTDKEFASVLTHEFGHYLNLAHTFDNECNAPGDNVDDTPATTSNYGSCNLSTEKCAGAGIPNAENYMDYSDCYKMFTQGQIARMEAALNHASRLPLWQDANLQATGVNGIGPHIAYSSSSFIEDVDNNGGIEGTSTLTASDGASFAITGSLTQGTHYTVTNIPSGLNVQLTVNSTTEATLSFTGNANNHANANDINNITITFLDAAITGGVSSIFNPSNSSIRINFFDPYQVVYGDIDDITVNSSAVWDFFSLNIGDADFGCWYDGGKLRLETYQKDLICEGSSRNVTYLPYGSTISTASNWVTGGAYPDEHDIRSDSYTTWDGQTGYMGFRFSNSFGRTLHGWFRIAVTADGSGYTLYDYAYHENPNGILLAGYTSDGGNGEILYGSTSFIEGTNNDGVVQGTANLTATNGASFAITGQLVEGVHFTTSNIPTGLTAQINVSSANSASLTFSGQANNHAANNTISDGNITFLDAALTGGTSSVSNPSFNALTFNFVNPYQIVYVDIDDITVNSTATWKYFALGIGNAEFGCWYDNGKLRLETYQKDMVCEGTSRNISLLPYGTEISTASNWITGGAYPDQHDIRSDSYTTWDGKTGYMGFRFTSDAGNILHGWFHISVNANGDSYTLLDYAYHEDPNGILLAGQTVGDGGGNAPEADFSASSTTITVGQSITFTDNSSNTPTSWSWTFEGGTPASSNEQNPVIIYNTAGTYAVTLTASNNSGDDTESKTNYITVNDGSGGSYCQASNEQPSGQYIKQVQFGDIDNSSTYNANGYADYTNLNTALVQGVPSTLTVTPHNTWANTAAKAWIDWNGDGTFSLSEEVFSASGSNGNYSVVINVPENAVETTRLRIRVGYATDIEPCGQTYFGEVEDYTVQISSNNTPGYCEVTNGAPNGQYIKQVQFGDIDNSSTYDASGYTDYTNLNTTITAGSTTSLTVTPHNTWSATAAKAWIDWNKDGVFSNDEEVLNGSGTGGSYTASVIAPSNAAGTTRLRVRTGYNISITPCDDEYFSEVEDYTIHVDAVSSSSNLGLSQSSNVRVFPNPTTENKFKLMLDFSAKQATINIMDLRGKVLLSQSSKNVKKHEVLPIELPKSAKGIYIIQLQLDNKLYTQKLVVE